MPLPDSGPGSGSGSGSTGGQELSESEAGPLIARLRNLLMDIPGEGYASGPPGSFFCWAGNAEAMEKLGASMQVEAPLGMVFGNP